MLFRLGMSISDVRSQPLFWDQIIFVALQNRQKINSLQNSNNT
jgi:hypothetical protein